MMADHKRQVGAGDNRNDNHLGLAARQESEQRLQRGGKDQRANSHEEQNAESGEQHAVNQSGDNIAAQLSHCHAGVFDAHRKPDKKMRGPNYLGGGTVVDKAGQTQGGGKVTAPPAREPAVG